MRTRILKNRWFISTLATAIAIGVPSPASAQADAKGGARPQKKILGGADAGGGEFPYMAGILSRSVASPYDAQFCGATVIHPRWAVTAAHCVEGETPSSIDVLVGARDLSNPGSAQRIPVADIVIFPGYNTRTNDGDIALLLLAQPVTVIGTFAKLATDPTTFAPGVNSTVLGWGTSTVAGDVYPSILQKVDLPVVSRATVQPLYDADGLTITDNMLFAGLAAGGKDSCSGDSGGPLLVPDGNGGYLLAGIISFGRPLDCGAPENYGAYTRIASYAPWIRSLVSPNRAAWESLYGASTDEGDIDGDRADGLLEFSAWTNPRSGSSLPVPTSGTVAVSGMTYPSITFRRLVAPAEITYGIESGNTLSAWAPEDTTALQVGLPQPIAGLSRMETVTVRGPSPITANPTGFLRLRVRPSDFYLPGIRELTFPGYIAGGLSNLEPNAPAPASSYMKNYRLVGLTPGTAVSLSLRSPQFDTGLSIINEATGSLVIQDTANAGGGTDDLLTFTPQAGVSYLARVASDSALGTGDFTLASFKPLATYPVIAGNGNTAGTLSITDPLDPLFLPDSYYKDDYLLTNAAVGSHLVLRMTSTAVDAFLAIVNAETGVLLNSDDDSATAGGTNAYVNFIVGSTIPLLVRASSAAQFQTGSYTLARSAGATVSFPQTINGSLSASDPVDPTLSPAAYYRDDYAITNLPVNQSATITVSSPGIDLFLALVDGVTGEVLRTIDVQFVGTPETFTFSRLPGQQLLLRVSSFDPQETGTYTITTSTP